MSWQVENRKGTRGEQWEQACVFWTTTKWKLILKKETSSTFAQEKQAFAANNVIVRICSSVWVACCAVVQQMWEKPTVLSHWFSCTLYLLLVWVLCKLQFDSLSPPRHAPVSGGLLCSALKAMCACGCSCGLPDVDQQSSNIFMVQSSRTCNSSTQNEEHKIICWKLELHNIVCLLFFLGS